MTRTITDGDGDHRHGTDNGYNNLKCRCSRCRAAHAEYYRVGKASESKWRYRQKLIDAGLTTRDRQPRVRKFSPRSTRGSAVTQ